LFEFCGDESQFVEEAVGWLGDGLALRRRPSLQHLPFGAGAIAPKQTSDTTHRQNLTGMIGLLLKESPFRRALEHVANNRERAWLATAGEIAAAYSAFSPPPPCMS
jgi:hypothetical protein